MKTKTTSEQRAASRSERVGEKENERKREKMVNQRQRVRQTARKGGGWGWGGERATEHVTAKTRAMDAIDGETQTYKQNHQTDRRKRRGGESKQRRQNRR